MERNVRDNISLVVLNQLRRFRFVRSAAERALGRRFTDRLRVRTPSLDQVVKNLSGGNQQKVVLARWLARRPKVLILDEPTRGIDVGAKAEIYRIIADLAQPTTGQTGLELQAITAAALGGALLTGGRGGVGGTVLAVLLISTLINGLTFLAVNSFWENIAQGTMLIAAVTIQKMRSGERRVGRPA